MFKKWPSLKFILWIFIIFSTISLGSCSRKATCPANERAHIRMGKGGKLPKGRGYTRLFPADFKKTMKKKKKKKKS